MLHSITSRACLGLVTLALLGGTLPARLSAQSGTGSVSPTEDPAAAQAKAMMRNMAANPATGFAGLLHGGMKRLLVETAERMPEKDYAFRPTEGVRTFGQLIGHIADTQYFFCGPVRGDASPPPSVEMSVSSKPALIAALRTALAYCDQAYADITDSTGGQMVRFQGAMSPKVGVLYASHLHAALHYGNASTYMRMRGLVPPSSDPVFNPHAPPPRRPPTP